MNALVARCDRIEDAPSFWFVIIPEEVYDLGRPLSRIPTNEKIQGKTRMSKAEALKLDKQPTLFGLEEAEADVYRYATHFRRQLKARLLSPKIVTQIVRETTLTPDDFLRSDGQRKRRIEDDATVAWKLTTGSYYKAGGRPWQLAGVREGVCYVGLAYKRREATADDGFACCAAQMFLSSGEGVVFRGALGPWYNSDTKQFHIDEPAAKRLIEMVVQEYRDQHDNKPPKELFLHAKSNFSDEEWTGFVSGAPPETNVVGVQISDAQDALKLFRPGKYPVLRGTALLLSESDAYLLTSPGRISCEEYVNGIESALPQTMRAVEIFSKRGVRNKDVADRLNQMFRRRDIRVRIYKTDDIHDRVWIKDSLEAFSIGTSFNGLGNKFAFILPLPSSDVRSFLSELQIRRSELSFSKSV
ncbi:hypothetical protein [Bradyrhizobium sp. TM102]|uniref:hypothetical protein n=1 Tax=Bradyrhizobium sp. TM102 TaxID=2599819 RepID=UPI0018D84CE7|nr:hypothetical protein [Bradyrhizobium sp. TM102]